MANAVTFDYSAWIVRYPQFGPSGATPVDQATAQAYFDEAGIYLDNTGCSPVQTDAQQKILMNMLTAHIATLNSPGPGGATSGLVGRISNASEGSVSVATQNDYPPGTVQWYQQTQFGSAYWVATAQYRMFKYGPGPVLGVPANQGGGLWSQFGVGLPFRGRGCR